MPHGHRRLLLPVLTTALVAGSAACDPLGPDEMEGSFTLVRLDGDIADGPPPQVVFTGDVDGQDFLLRVLWGTLEIRDERYTLTLGAECEIDGQVSTACTGENDSAGRYHRDGETVTFMPENATADPDLGQWDPRNQRITYIDTHDLYGSLTAIFERQ